MKKISIGILVLVLTGQAIAQDSPWLPIPGSTNLALSYVNQQADDFFRGDQSSSLGDDLTQTTVWLKLTHGLSENLSLDGRIGFADSQFDPVGSESGLADSKFGISYRLVDEALVDGAIPSFAVRAGVILEGNYDTGAVNSIGDGSDGAELGFLVGRIFDSGLALNADAGYRYRSSLAPDELFVNLAGHYAISGSLSGSLTYQNISSRGDLDIGAPGFSPERFPEAKESLESLGIGLFYQVNQTAGVGLNYGAVIDGRNTSDSNIFALTYSQNF